MDWPRLVALLALLISVPEATGQPCGIPVAPCGYYLAADGKYYPAPPLPPPPGALGPPPPSGPLGPPPQGGPDATTEEAPASSTWNQFNEAGWHTDDNGNVFVGDDNAKLYLISVGSFWPFPKDYKKK